MAQHPGNSAIAQLAEVMPHKRQEGVVVMKALHAAMGRLVRDCTSISCLHTHGVESLVE